jgi:SAM-dependent methyltransferase
MAMSMSAQRPGPDPGELEFLEPYLRSNEEPFLELACGYGRLLLPIMEQGYDIVGTDASPEMLARCREIAREKDLNPVLREQFMQRLSLESTFGFIFIDDCTFTLVIDDTDVDELFARVYRHLKPGGTFLFDFFTVRPDARETSNEVSESWGAAPDGSLYVSKKISSYDPDTHVITRLQIHDLYVDGNFVGSQAYQDPNREHDPEEVLRRLAEHGFVDIRLGGYHTDDPPSSEAGMVSIRCRRP